MRTCISILILAAVGCARQPTVPENMLSSVPPTTVERLAPLHQVERDLTREIAAAEARLARALADERNAQERADAVQQAMASDERLEQIAVERGDPEGAASADQRAASYEATWAEVSAELAAARHTTAYAAAELEWLESERDLVQAQIQLVQAQAVADEEDLSVNRFERAVERATERRDEARQEVERIRTEVPTTDAT